MVNLKKKELRVILEFVFARSLIDAVPQSVSQPHPKPLTAAQIKAKAVEEKKAKDVEDRARERARINEQKMILIETFKCPTSSCPNFEGGQCYVDNGRHFKLETTDINVWNEAINKENGSASVSRPPAELRRLLKPTILAGPKKGKAPSPSPSLASTSTIPSAASNPGLTMQELLAFESIQEIKERRAERREERRQANLIVESKAPDRSVSQSPMLTIETNSYAIPSPRSRALSSLPDAPPPSSPVEGNDMYEYVLWLVERKKLNPETRDKFLNAGNILIDEGYDLQTIQEKKGPVHEGWWKSMKIPKGIGHQLARDISRYGKHKAELEKSSKFKCFRCLIFLNILPLIQKYV